MTRTTTNRPRMAATFAPGTVRARRWHGDGDVRGYCSPSGWTARTDLADIHPITSRASPRAVWWLIETKEKPRSAPRPSRSVLGAVDAKNPGAAMSAPGVQDQQPNQNAAAIVVAQAALKHPSGSLI